jgi:hypothetical protein
MRKGEREMDGVEIRRPQNRDCIERHRPTVRRNERACQLELSHARSDGGPTGDLADDQHLTTLSGDVKPFVAVDMHRRTRAAGTVAEASDVPEKDRARWRMRTGRRRRLTGRSSPNPVRLATS